MLAIYCTVTFLILACTPSLYLLYESVALILDYTSLWFDLGGSCVINDSNGAQLLFNGLYSAVVWGSYLGDQTVADEHQSCSHTVFKACRPIPENTFVCVTAEKRTRIFSSEQRLLKQSLYSLCNTRAAKKKERKKEEGTENKKACWD